jgi:IPT/TIG domain
VTRTNRQRTDARRRRIAPAALLVVLLLAFAAAPGAAQAYRTIRSCGQPSPGRAACLAMRALIGGRTARSQRGRRGASRAAAAPAGERTKPFPGFLTPELLHDAYELPVETTAGTAQTIALVDAFDDPTAEADLAVFDKEFGLPACTNENGCFKKINQNGAAGPLPKVDGGWASEISIDVQMAHAICQNCKILLVETNSEEFTDLSTGANTAVAHGATVVSNSYGGAEEPADSSLAAAYDHPGIVITVSSGDCGYRNTACIHRAFGANFPADTSTVVAVGGTALSESGTGWTSTVWDEAGSGCSELFSAQSWQSSAPGFAATGCDSGRGVADVAAIGDPNTGVDVYDSTPESPGASTGWGVWGGTSVSSPIVAGEFALAGGSGGVAYPAGTLYAHLGESQSLYDVTSGSNGECEGSTICTAAAGFDGPTGVGSPVGLGAFAVAGAPELVSRPAISGFAEEGATLTESHGSWTGTPTSYAYQWERCGFSGGNCRPIAGASEQTLVVPPGYVGSTIRVRETARNAAGANSAASSASAPVASNQPLVSAVSPAVGITGSSVTVEGQALDQATSVELGTLPASFSVISATKLSVTVPNGAGKGKISVTTPHGTATGKQKFIPSLSVVSFSPSAGAAGTLVTIKGVGFNASSAVAFAGTPASIVSSTAKKIRVHVPAGAGTGPIEITNTTAPAGTVLSATAFGP